jgi:hypothetical protein
MNEYVKPPYTVDLSDSMADDESDCWVIDNDRGSVAEITCPLEDAEATARFLARAGNAHQPLVEALTRLRDWANATLGGGLEHELFDGKATCEPDCLRCAVNIALATATFE